MLSEEELQPKPAAAATPASDSKAQVGAADQATPEAKAKAKEAWYAKARGVYDELNGLFVKDPEM
jgi:hypothetical protein